MPRSVTVRSTGRIVAGWMPSLNKRRPESSTTGNVIRPVAAEDVQRSATEQARAGAAVELGDEFADGWVGERGLPAAVGEGVAGVFLRSAGGLHHAVEGQERLHGELHVTGDEAAH